MSFAGSGFRQGCGFSRDQRHGAGARRRSAPRHLGRRPVPAAAHL